VRDRLVVAPLALIGGIVYASVRNRITPYEEQP
jgi:hypothetical protein